MGKPFKLANGLLLLSTEAPGGIYNSTQLKKIAALCDGDSSVVKATEDQRLAIFVASDKAAKVAAELKAVGLGVRHYQDGLHQPVNCLGEMCSEHLQDAMGTSMELTKELSGTTLGTPLKIGINGCARSCVATHTLDISIIGDSNGYRVSLGGKNSQLPEMASFMAEGVPAAKLPKLIAKVVSVYKELAQKDETLQEVTERVGSKKFIEALAPYSQDAAQDDPFSGLGEESAAAPASAGPGIDSFEESELSAGSDDLQVMEDEVTGVPEDIDMSELAAAPATASTDDLEMAMDDVPAPAAASDDLDMEMEEAPVATDDLELSMDDSPALSDEMSMEDAPLATDDLAMEAATEDLGMGTTDELSMDSATEDLGMETTDELSMEAATEDLGTGVTDELSMESAVASDDLELSMDEAPVVTDDLELAMEEPAIAATSDEDLDLTMDEAPMEELTMEDVETPAPVAAPAPKPIVAMAPPPAMTDDADDLTADEVSDADADAFEEKLNASIAEEEAYPEIEDANSLDRLEAMKLVEEGGEAPVLDAPSADGRFDNLGIDHDEEIFDDEQTAAAMPSATHGSVGFDFVGFDLAGDRVSLNFSSGASVAIDPRMITQGSRRDLTVGGKKISIGHVEGGLEVEVDGVAIFLPKRAA